MALGQKLDKFARKSPRDKLNALLAPFTPLRRQILRTVAGTQAFRRGFLNAQVSKRAQLIPSGLGNSANVLYGLVRSMKPDVCVEIGSALGKSACYVGMALKENGHGMLYAIDPHTVTDWNDSSKGASNSLAPLQRNIAAIGVSEQVTIVRSYSQDAANTWKLPIDLIFIDGDHSYEGVKRDFELFAPHVKAFGMVVFHDTIWDLPPYNKQGGGEERGVAMGVPRFVDELRQQGYPVLTIDRDCGVSVVQPVIGGVPLRASIEQALEARNG